MKYMLDTNICILAMKNRLPVFATRIKKHRVGEIGCSTVTLAELKVGGVKSARPEYHEMLVVNLFRTLVIADFDSQAATSYGFVRAYLEWAGTPIGPLDMLIAAHALSMGATVVTNNEREFRRVKGLAVENWL